MSGFLSLFSPAQAATIGSVDNDAPGGIVQVPVPPGYTTLYPGYAGVTPETPVSDGGTVTITPGSSGEGDDSGGLINFLVGGTPTSSLPPTIGNAVGAGQSGQTVDGLPAGDAGTGATPGAVGNAVGGLPGAIGNAVGGGSAVFNYIEELAIRAAIIIVGLVLIAGGFYAAGARGKISGLVR